MVKSTKIEDLIESNDDPDEDIELMKENNDDVRDELKSQLDNLQAEFSNIKKTKGNDDTGSIEPPRQFDAGDNSEKKTLFFNMDRNDIKQIGIIMIAFLMINISFVNDTIDHYIPYSMYSYSMLFKAVGLVLIYKLLDSIKIF